jgi:hypothetical protein
VRELDLPVELLGEEGASTVAERFLPSAMSAISPKLSPGPRIPIVTRSPSGS